MEDKLNSCIEIALDKACPLTDAKIVDKNNPWWTDQLQDLRKSVTNLYKRCIINPIQGNMTKYKKVLRQYKNLCYKKKEEDRKRTNEVVPNEGEMAKHTKKILAQTQRKLGSLEKDTGGYTDDTQVVFR